MRNLIWVRIFIASFALLGENALASENNARSTDSASFIGQVADTSIPLTASGSDSDNHLFIASYRLVSFTLQQINSYLVLDSESIPVQSRYLLSYSRAPPVKLI